MRVTLLMFPALVAAATACDIFAPENIDYRQRAIDETARRESLWTALDVHSYDFGYQRDCNCSPVAIQEVRIHVRNDVITRVVDAQGNDVPPQPDVSWPTVDSLFLWGRQFLADRRIFVEMDFDTTYNFPTHVRGDIPGQLVAEHNAGVFTEQPASAP